MDSNDEDRPTVTDLDSADALDQVTLTPQPWLRRFASVVGFASAGVGGPGGNQSMV